MDFCWLEISKSALKYNIKQFRKIIGPKVKLMAVVKSNAYGHGMIPCAKIAQNDLDWLGVVNLDEALKLREAKIKSPILVLSYSSCGGFASAILKRIDLPIYDFNQAQSLSETAKKLKRIAKIHIKIDTGTSRLGILKDDALDFIKKIKKLPNLKIYGIFSHYASSEERDQTFTNWQTERFKNLLEKLKQEGIKIPLAHIGCSASTILNPKSHFDMVRIGISFFGLWPSMDIKKLAKKLRPGFNLKPALTWKTRIIQIKKLAKGTFVGYGCSYKTKRLTKLAVLPCGYYEGYQRALSNPGKKGEVLIKGKRCKILGRVCMNIIMVDITDIPKVKLNDEVVLIGKQGKEEITADEIAKKIGTINYEVVSRINPDLPRIYIN